MSLKFADLRNSTDMNFADISSEKYRTYKFSDNNIHLKEPIALHVSKSGGHRLLLASGKSHYVPTGWRDIEWEAKDGMSHFVK